MATSYKSPQDLFKALESTHISDLLFELIVHVKVANVDGSISFRELSEGEQQLLLVLGLLRFTKEDEALFLLDEPDTHLNPAWSVQYLRFVEQMVGSQLTSQIIMATHDPLMFGGLQRQQVRIMNFIDGGIGAEQPDEDPRGMGIEAILTSELFGLRAALDLPTLEELDKQRKLTLKTNKTKIEEQELVGLNEKLTDLGYTKEVSDPLYPLFVDAMTKWQQMQGSLNPILSHDEQKAQKDKALEVVGQLRKADRRSEK